MMKTATIIAAVAGLALTAGASASASDGPAAAKPAAKRSCFFADQVNGWRSDPDEKTVYLEVGAKTIYRAELFSRCNDIDSALTIGLATRGGGTSICDGLDVDLIVGSAIGPQRCPVTRLTRLTPEEAAALPRKLRP